MPALNIVLIIIAALVVLILIICYIFSGIVMYSRRQPIVRTPAEYNMPYEDVAFKSTDGLTIKGWFIPSPDGKAEKVIILTHPMPMNRHGFLPNHIIPILDWKL